jgi:alanine-glyoxylate transaminase/serine-glyoxylate transaminase/serine-pyruvate transaminase
MLPGGRDMDFTCTPAVNLFFALKEALAMLSEEGLPTVFQRHHRLAAATRSAVRAWGGNGGIELQAQRADEQSDSVSAIRLPAGHDAEAIRALARERFNTVLGGGLLRLRGQVFRIGHLGDLNEPMLLGALAASEMALQAAGVPHNPGGVQAALNQLAAPVAKGEPE